MCHCLNFLIELICMKFYIPLSKKEKKEKYCLFQMQDNPEVLQAEGKREVLIRVILL